MLARRRETIYRGLLGRHRARSKSEGVQDRRNAGYRRQFPFFSTLQQW